MIKFLKEKLVVKNPYKKEFTELSRKYNNAACFYVTLVYILFTILGGLAMISSGSQEAVYVIPIYAGHICLSIISLFILAFIKKKKLYNKLISEIYAIVQICISMILILLASHFEIQAIGIKNINVIILTMFVLVFYLHFDIFVTLSLEIVFLLAAEIFLVFEMNDISNFSASFTNLFVAGFLACSSSYLYWRLRLENFIHTNDLKKLTTSDALTEIYNRRGFDIFFSKTWEELILEKGQLALFIIDIDYFKKYNDIYGHLKGDTCIKVVANSLEKSIRKNDYVARYGGEEFAIIMKNTNYSAAELVAKRIFENIEEQNLTHEVSDISNRVTVSVGCMIGYPGITCLKQSEFISLADKALYEAKENGRNQIVFHSRAIKE